MSLKKLIKYQGVVNIADELDEDQLRDIGHMVVRDYMIDEASRSDFIDTMKQAMAIAKQIPEEKSFPWPGASNVKYPLIAGASIQFAARTYPEIVKGDKVVHVAVLGEDEGGQKTELARRISKQMSDQLLILSNEWEPGTDKLLHMLPIMGTVFRKTYWHEIAGHARSEVVTPDELIINNNVKSLEDARRITHIIYMHKNDIVSRQNAGLFRDLELKAPAVQDINQPIRDAGQIGGDNAYDMTDGDVPFVLLEQHRYLDLDEDGYEEPYVVTVEKGSCEVLRIVPRFDFDDIQFDDAGEKIVRINPVQYFTAYPFIPDPAGGFYGIGFGQILLPLNKTINTILNQLIDSGTLANMQGGFFGRGIRFKNGKVTPKPGEWIPLEATGGASLKENIMPFPFKEPSNVLFQLLGLMLEAGKELSSVSDAMQGNEQAQNVPATTILALIEQGQKVFGAIQKRLYRAFKQEFEKLYRLNALYLNQSRYNFGAVSSNPPTAEDYKTAQFDVRPVADPTVSSEAQRMARIQAMMQAMPMLPPGGQQAALVLYFRALQFSDPDIQALLPMPDPNAPPPPEMQKIIAETQAIGLKAQKDLIEMQIKHGDQELKLKELEIRALEAMAQVKNAEANAMASLSNAETAKIKASADLGNKATKSRNSENGQLTAADAARYEQAAKEIIDQPDLENERTVQAPPVPMEAGPSNEAPMGQPPGITGAP